MKASNTWHGVKMTPEILRESDRLGAQPVKTGGREQAAV